MSKESFSPNVGKLKSDFSGYTKNMTAEQLEKVIELLSDYYYNREPIVSDAKFDSLVDRLAYLNPESKTLKKIGAAVSMAENISTISGSDIVENPKHREKTQLPYWMGSMNKVKAKNLINWFKKFQSPYVLTDKMDGVSALYHYDGEYKLYSRGDGQAGMDISFLLPYLNLPKTDRTIRGELIMEKDLFNHKYSRDYANPRNLVSRITTSKTLSIDFIKDIHFIAYELVGEGKLSDGLKFLNKKGFRVVPNRMINSPLSEEEMVQYLAKRKNESLYDIDGIIITSDMPHERNVEGNPEYAVAFKAITDIGEQVKEATVKRVQWNIQKDGYLFPVVKIKEIPLLGVNINNCSGKNAKFIVDNVIGPGSKILVTREKDVTPGIYDVLEPSLTGQPDLPDELEYHWSDSKVDIILNDSENNEEVQLRKLVYFFKTVGVVGFGEGNVTKCYNNGLDTIPKILSASKDDFLKLPGVKETMANKIYNSIRDAFETISHIKLMVGSSEFGRGIGAKKLQLVMENYPDLLEWEYTLENITKLVEIKSIEMITAEKILSNVDGYIDFFDELPQWVKDKFSVTELVSETTTVIEKSNRFEGENVVFSGFRNKEWENIITGEGGKVGSAISGNTTLVVVKDLSSTSQKILKAKEKGIKIIEMKDFII